MTGTYVKLCGGAILLVVAILLLKQTKTDVWPLQWLGILLTAGAGLLLLEPVLSWFRELSEANGIGNYTDCLLRALGVAFLTQGCADLCRQSGEASLASGVELAGKAELLLLALPLLRELLSVAGTLLSGL